LVKKANIKTFVTCTDILYQNEKTIKNTNLDLASKEEEVP